MNMGPMSKSAIDVEHYRYVRFFASFVMYKYHVAFLKFLGRRVSQLPHPHFFGFIHETDVYYTVEPIELLRESFQIKYKHTILYVNKTQPDYLMPTLYHVVCILG